MSLAARIRAQLENGPQTSRQIADAIGTTSNKVSMSINCMARDGMIATDDNWPRVHTLLRNARTVASPEERAARIKEGHARRNLKRRRARGVLPREEYIAKRKAQAEELAKIRRMTAKIAAENRKAEERGRKAQERHAAAGRINIAITPKAPSVVELAPSKPVLMTSQEWEAMGGEVQRLPSNLGAAYAGLNANLVSLY